MIITKEILKAWDGKRIVYKSKSMLFSAVLTFSYEFDEDRFIAASTLEVKSLGKTLFEESRSSRYFTKPELRWSDFTYNGKIINPPGGSMDLCLLPMLFDLNVSAQENIFLNDWKVVDIHSEGNRIFVDGGKAKLEFLKGSDGGLQSLRIATPVKDIKMERV
jgi:hypothetical protein